MGSSATFSLNLQTVRIIADWRDLERLWEEAVANSTYNKQMHMMVII
jgi:hypothetical protein